MPPTSRSATASGRATLTGLLALAIGVAGSPLDAQSVHGVVTDPATGHPVSGAVVALYGEPDRSFAAGTFAFFGGSIETDEVRLVAVKEDAAEVTAVWDREGRLLRAYGDP